MKNESLTKATNNLKDVLMLYSSGNTAEIIKMLSTVEVYGVNPFGTLDKLIRSDNENSILVEKYEDFRKYYDDITQQNAAMTLLGSLV